MLIESSKADNNELLESKDLLERDNGGTIQTILSTAFFDRWLMHTSLSPTILKIIPCGHLTRFLTKHYFVGFAEFTIKKKPHVTTKVTTQIIQSMAT